MFQKTTTVKITCPAETSASMIRLDTAIEILLRNGSVIPVQRSITSWAVSVNGPGQRVVESGSTGLDQSDRNRTVLR
jgi:hypothetical protein